MSKILLIDGHSILNRAFYGLPDLTNSKGQHTNAVLGFLNILLKLIDEENPTHLVVAFDRKEKTFRHIKYEAYKGTRKGMPEELHEQVPMMKEMLHAMGIKTMECPGLEADDLLGTMSRRAEKKGFKVTIVSGDRDLLQLATDEILVRIPKTKMSGTVIEDYYAKDVTELYGVTPFEFIEMKGLMGDSSDNIPGVPGIGPKTASSIIQTYKSIENAYAHIEEVKPNKARENLKEYYEQAILSRDLATIELNADYELDLDETKIDNIYTEAAYQLMKDYEFKKLIARFEEKGDQKSVEVSSLKTIEYEMIDDSLKTEEILSNIKKETGDIGIAYALNKEHELQGISIAYAEKVYVFPVWFMQNQAFFEELLPDVLKNKKIGVFDLKGLLHLLCVDSFDKVLDLSVAGYLLNPLKDSYDEDDIARDYMNLTIPSRVELLGKKGFLEADYLACANKLNYEQALANMAYICLFGMKSLEDALLEKDMLDLYWNIEFPTIYALYDMERFGILVDKGALKKYGEQLESTILSLEKEIHELAGEEFNILSPKQLGVILFEHLGLPNGKKTKTGYSTSADVLEKIKNEHPIIEKILTYRQYTKLKSTYADGLANYIKEDGRIHGTFNQTITATGRISSTEPNLQNIPMRMPLGREIRKVFIPKEGCVFIDADYSQIELRVLAHLSNDDNMIKAFMNNEDIHASTAAKVFDVPIESVTSLQRRNAKAVNFGIVYGISAFGLSQDINVSRKEAQEFIDKYFETYNGIKGFLDQAVSKCKEQGYCTTMYHRYRPVPEILSSNFMQRSFGERIAMNSPIQGSAADIIKIAMIKVRQALIEKQLKSRLILQIHDELLIEAEKDEVDQVKELLIHEMMNAASLRVPLLVDAHEGDNWLEAK